MAKQIHIRLEDSLFEALSEYADKTGQSVQDTIIRSIMQMLSNQSHPSTKKGSFYIYRSVCGNRWNETGI